MSQHAILIVNTRSRKSKKLLNAAIVLLNTHDIQLVAIHTITSSKSIKKAIEASLSSPCNLIIIASGDGTISSIIDHFVYTDKILAFLPFGTTNNFARTLNIPLTLPEAVAVIAGKNVQTIDIGKVNNDYFANVTTIGLSGAIAQDVPHVWKKYLGRLAYLLTGITTLFKHKPFTCHIHAPGFQETFKTHQIIVANGRFHAGRLIEPEAQIDNSLFVIFTLGGFSRAQFIHSTIAFLFGKHKEVSGVFYKQAKEFTITLDAAHTMEVDGEPYKVTQAHFVIAEKALNVVTPLIKH